MDAAKLTDRVCEPRELAQWMAKSRAAAAWWAAEVLADPASVVLDLETTGLQDCRIVSVTVVDGGGQVLLDQLVNPGVPIPPDSSSIHGITDGDVADAAGFAELVSLIVRTLRDRRLIIFNAEFDLGVLREEGEAAGSSSLQQLKAECAMGWYSQWRGEWQAARGEFRRQRLNGPHSSAGDCLAVLDRLTEMADSVELI